MKQPSERLTSQRNMVIQLRCLEMDGNVHLKSQPFRGVLLKQLEVRASMRRIYMQSTLLLYLK